MRDILFRGKERFNGKWLYGNLIKYRNGEFAIQSMDKDHNVAVPVIADTIGQYTGLTDRNGTKIFEGDIVKYGDTIHEVVFETRNKTAYFGLVYSSIETLTFGHYQDLRQIQVIGNIYDNPELLKEQEQ